MNDKGLLKKRSVHINIIVISAIFLLTCIVYTPALKNDFVWDDKSYIYENTNIQHLDIQSLRWMLTSFHASNWHPLTWLSLAIDYALWGFDPLGYHLTNIIMHGLNTLLVFFLTIRLFMKAKEANGMSSPPKMPGSISTQALIVAGITALLFGLHPLHVESVAWIAERKDLLCAFFFLLTLLSYLFYASSVVKRHRFILFTACLFLFIFALMSKPMAVTLPVILLLLDLYPLKRLERPFQKNLSVLVEKMPFFILSIASGIITIMAQHSGGAVRSLERFSIDTRLLNALMALVFYLEKMFVPLKLVPFYPFLLNIHWLDLRYLLSGILVLAITAGCLRFAMQGKYLLFSAWSYYVITLLPVLGIIQVGTQARADRYTYLPSISIFLLSGIAVAWCWEKTSFKRYETVLRGLLFAFICTVVFSLSYLTISQLKIWKNSIIFWNYITSVFPKTSSEAYGNLGVAYAKKGRLDEAISAYETALTMTPNHAGIHINLGVVYGKKGKLEEAISAYEKALTIKPDSEKVLNNLGNVYIKKGKLDEAISAYQKALTNKPNYAEAHYNLGLVYDKKGRLEEAISEYKKALAINPNLANLHHNLGLTYAKKGKLEEAISEYKKALSINPDLAETYYKLGSTLEAKGKLSDAISAYREAIRLKHDYVMAYNNLAWIYATSPNSTIRNGDKSVALATKACELTGFKEAWVLDTLAAAYAEQGNFKKAVEYQTRAIDLSPKKAMPAFFKRLELYQSRQAYRYK